MGPKSKRTATDAVTVEEQNTLAVSSKKIKTKENSSSDSLDDVGAKNNWKVVNNFHQTCFFPPYLNSNDTKLLISERNCVKIIDITNGQTLANYPSKRTCLTTPFITNDDIIVVNYDNIVKLNSQLTLVEELLGKDSNVVKSKMTNLSSTPDGSRLVCSFYQDVRVWDMQQRQMIKKFKVESDTLCTVDIDASGQFLVTGGQDKLVKLWNATTGKLIRSFSGHTDFVSAVKFNSTATLVASGADNDDKSIIIWDVASGAQLHQLKKHSFRVNDVAWSSDDSLLVSGSYDKTVNVWSVATGAHIQTLRSHQQSVDSVAFTKDVSKIVSHSRQDEIIVWALH